MNQVKKLLKIAILNFYPLYRVVQCNFNFAQKITQLSLETKKCVVKGISVHTLDKFDHRLIQYYYERMDNLKIQQNLE